MIERLIEPLMPIALLLALEALVLAPALAGGAGAGEAREPVEALIQKLGDSSWQVREASQEALLTCGSEAVEPLARAAASANPEVALRARFILSRVNPLKVLVRIQRIELDAAPRIGETFQGEVSEGVEAQLPPRPDTPAYSVRCRVLGERQVDLTVEEILNGSRSLLQTPAFPEGTVGYIKRGEEGIYRQIGLHIDRERHPFAIVLRWWMAPSFPVTGQGVASLPATDLPALVGDLIAQAGSGEIPPRLAALDLLGLLRAKEADPAFRAARAEPRLQAAALAGLAGLGDREALDELEKIADSPAPRPSRNGPPEARGKKVRAQGLDALGIQQPGALLEGQSPEAGWQNRAMLALLLADRPAGFDILAHRISEIDSLAIHTALAELSDRLDRVPPDSRDLLLDTVTSPEFLTQLLWDDPEIEHFYGALIESAEVSRKSQFHQRLLLGLSRTLGADPWSTSARHRIFARLWERISLDGGDAEVLHGVLKDVLDRAGSPSRLNEIVSWLGLCFREQPMPEEEFDKVLALLRGAILKDSDRGPTTTMASNALAELAHTLALTEPQMVALAKLLAEAAQSPKQQYASQFLREVERLTGISAQRGRTAQPGVQPVQGPVESIASQVDQWAAKPEETSAAYRRLNPPPAAAGGEALEYWEFDILIIDPPRDPASGVIVSTATPLRQIEVLDGHRIEARAGVPVRFIDRWGNRLTCRLDPENVPGVSRYRINGQTTLDLGLPSFINGREKETRIGRYETSDIRLGTTPLSNPRGQRLLRLACVRPGGRSAAAAAPPEPAALWQDFLGGLFDGLDPRNAERSFQIIRELNLREAVPFLKQELQREEVKTAPRWDFPYNVARWLLERGDAAGRDFLIGELESAEPRRRMQAAQMLAGGGDATGFRALLKVLKERPRELNPHVAISGLDAYLREKPLDGEECREAVDILIQNLHEPLFQPASFALIARLAGNDFGYQAAIRQAGAAEARKQAVARAVEGARAWWSSRKPSSADPADAPKK
jgi:hypothetical protein